MKKIFSKVAILTLGVALAAGAGVALSVHKEAMGVAAEDGSVTLAYTGGVTGNFAEETNVAAEVGLSATDWEVIAAKGSNTNNVGYNKAKDIRLYYGNPNSNSLTITSLQNWTITTIAVTYTGATYNNAAINPGTLVNSGTTGTGSVDNTSFTLTNANSSNVQVRISNIVINYTTGGVVKTDTTTTVSLVSGKTTLDLAADPAETAQLGATVTANAAAVPGATVTWSSTDESVATVSSTGLVTPHKAGTTSVSASYAGDDTYKASSDSMTITVFESQMAVYFSAVTSADELYDGGTYILASEVEEGVVQVLSTTQATNNRPAVAASVVDGLVEVNDTAVEMIKLAKEGEYYTFGVDGGYLYAASSNNNWLRTQAENDANGEWAITFTDGVASVVAQGSNTRNVMHYNPNNGSPVFSAYASTSSVTNPVCFYRLNFEETLLRDVVCDGQGSHTLAPAATWAKFEALFNSLSVTERNAMKTARSDGLERYDFLVAKYSETKGYNNFIGRTITPLAASLIGEGEGASFNTTALIAVVAAIALTSVAGIVTVIIIRRRRFHN